MDTLAFTIALLAFLATFALGTAFLSWRNGRRVSLKRRLDVFEDLDGDEQNVGEKLGSLARFSKSFSAGKPSAGLKARLAKAGYHDSNATAVFLGSKALALLFGTLITLACGIAFSMEFFVLLLLAISVGAAVSFVPNFFVRMRRLKRTEEIRIHLPDAVDLLEICVSSGMGMDTAWNSVADEIRGVSETLADEMALTNLEMHLGATRAVALRHMVARTGADELASLVAVLVQTDRFGTSMTEALQTFAKSMREGRSQRAEEAAEKSAVKLLFPMICFIFPAVLIVAAGPGVLRLADVMFGS